VSDETTTGDENAIEDPEKTPAKRPSPTSRARRIGGRPTPRPSDSPTGGTPTAGTDAAEPAAAPPAQLVTEPVTVDKAPRPASTSSTPERTKDTPSPAAKDSVEPAAARRTVPVPWIPASVLGLAVLVLLVLVVIASHGVYWAKPNASSGARTANQEQVLAATKKCFAQINTYDYRHLDATLIRNDLACTTGRFTADLRRTLTTQIIPRAPKVKAAQTAQVNRAGIASVSPTGTQVVVLIYGQIAQSNTITAKNSPRVDVIGAIVTVDKVKDTWLIAKIDTDVGT
jgi:hypothetical protein